MTYSCGIFSRGAKTLEEAQHTKLDLVASKLELEPGHGSPGRWLGWGSFAIHAARHYGVTVTGVTLLRSPRPSFRAQKDRPSRPGGQGPEIRAVRLPPAAAADPSTRLRALGWPGCWRTPDRSATPAHCSSSRPDGSGQLRTRRSTRGRTARGRILDALRLPRRKAAATLHACSWRWSAPAFRQSTSRASATRRLFAYAQALERAVDEHLGAGAVARRARTNARSGDCTCERHASGSKPTTRPSTRFARAEAPEKLALQAGPTGRLLS